MRGIPKHLNSRFDYEYIRLNLPEEKWRREWQELLDERFVWTTVSRLGKGDKGVVDDTHRVFETPESPVPGAPAVRFQQELRESATAPIFRMGFTVAEVEEALGNAGAGATAANSEEVYLLNSSGTYHKDGCGYASASAESLGLDEIAAAKPGAKPCSRCDPPSLS